MGQTFVVFQDKLKIVTSVLTVASFENTVQSIGVVTSALSNPSTQKMRKLRPRKGKRLGHNDPAH